MEQGNEYSKAVARVQKARGKQEKILDVHTYVFEKKWGGGSAPTTPAEQRVARSEGACALSPSRVVSSRGTADEGK